MLCMYPVSAPDLSEPFNAFWARRLREQGALVPGHRAITQGWTLGTLSLNEEKHGGRHCLVARFRARHSDQQVFYPLIEARLVHFDGTHMLLAGLELDEALGRAWAQSWKLMSPLQEPGGRSDTRNRARAPAPA